MVEGSKLICFADIIDEMLTDSEIIRPGCLTKDGRTWWTEYRRVDLCSELELTAASGQLV